MKWTDELIKEELLKSIEFLGIERMPTGDELKSIGRNDLHCKISRTKKYSGWAEELGISLKSSATVTGNQYEEMIAEGLRISFKVETTSTKHPYDLLVEGCLKIDVKSSRPYTHRGTYYTFHLAKTQPTCDIYILLLLDEEGEVKKELIIPSHLARQQTITVTPKSEWLKYEWRQDLIDTYVDFYNGVR